MKKQLRNNLLGYLGELKSDYENNFDTFEKAVLITRMNLVEKLLEIPETRNESWFYQTIRAFKNNLK